jgi:hypothetical protein
MKLVDKRLSGEEIGEVRKKFGDYMKVTGDIVRGVLVIGPELHADAVPILKKGGSFEENVWGGWVNLADNQVESTAVWNIKPGLDNPGMDIYDQEIREKFIKLVKFIFGL